MMSNERWKIPKRGDFVAKLSAFNALDRACGLCGENTWQIPLDHDEEGVAFCFAMPLHKRNHLSVPFIPMICVNCGNTHFIHLETAMGWKDE